jgi:hypothetical protein
MHCVDDELSSRKLLGAAGCCRRLLPFGRRETRRCASADGSQIPGPCAINCTNGDDSQGKYPHPIYGTLGDTLTDTGGSPNGSYWLYKWYGDMSGSMVPTTPPAQAGIDGAASSEGRRPGTSGR